MITFPLSISLKSNNAHLYFQVLEKLEQLVRRGVIFPGDVDGRIIEDLKEITPDTALLVLSEFSVCDRAKVKNVSGYLSGTYLIHIC